MKSQLVAATSLLVVASIAACSSGPAATPSPVPPIATPTAAPTAAPTATPEPTPTAGLSAQPLFRRTGKAGVFSTMAENPGFLLTLPDGWDLYFDEPGGVYMGIPDGELLIGRPQKAIDPATQDPITTPDDLFAWLADHPDLNPSAPASAEISGHAASYVDVDPTRSVDVFYDPLGNFHVGPGPMARFYVVPWEGDDVFIAVLRSPSGVLDDALATAGPILESLVIVE